MTDHRRSPFGCRAALRDGSGGYVLMELMLAMAIIAMLAALALPVSRPGGGGAVMRVKALEVAALLRDARNAALTSGDERTVFIDRETGTIRSDRSVIDLSAAVPLDVLPTGLRAVRFFPDGRTSGGTLVLGSSRSAMVVRVNAVTAAVDVSGN